MQEQPQDYKLPYHLTHLRSLLLTLLKQPTVKYQTLFLTTRTSQIVYSLLSESDLYGCGYKKIIHSSTVNPYMSYQDIVMVLSVGEEDWGEIAQYGRQIDRVYLVNLGVCTPDGKALLRKLQFKEKDSIKGYKQENLDFFCYLHNTFILATRPNNEKAKQSKNKSKNKIKELSDQSAIDRLCSFLFSYDSFSQFQFYLPKNRNNLAKLIKQTMQAKLKILNKYEYKGLSKNQGMSAIKTKIIVLQRSEQISPFILSLHYGPLAQQLNTGNSCRFVSTHSTIYNKLYHLDLLSASQQLTLMLQDLSSNKKKQINTTNYTQTKKILSKAYNPNMSKQELSFHQALLREMNKFMEQNCQLLALQQSIGNKVNELGQQMGGGAIVEAVYEWCKGEGNSGRYDRYLGLIAEAVTVHGYWWFQRNQLMGGVSDQADKEALQKYCKGCKIHSLKQKPPKKDQDGSELRQKCFRHNPPIVEQFQKIEAEVKTKKLQNCQLLKINQQENSLAKKSRTIVYINDIIGYNELAMLLALNKQDIQFVCRNIKNTKQWTSYKLFPPEK